MTAHASDARFNTPTLRRIDPSGCSIILLHSLAVFGLKLWKSFRALSRCDSYALRCNNNLDILEIPTYRTLFTGELKRFGLFVRLPESNMDAL